MLNKIGKMRDFLWFWLWASNYFYFKNPPEVLPVLLGNIDEAENLLEETVDLVNNEIEPTTDLKEQSEKGKHSVTLLTSSWGCSGPSKPGTEPGRRPSLLRRSCSGLMLLAPSMASSARSREPMVLAKILSTLAVTSSWELWSIPRIREL